MTAPTSPPQVRRQAEGAGRHPSGLSWIREVALVAVVYGTYTLIRNQFGSARLDDGSRSTALGNAVRVIDVERALRIFREVTVQHWFMDTSAISFFNVYYGVAHSLCTVGVLFWLLLKRADHFRRWRTILLFTTVLGLVGYATFPLMPPRLIDATGKYGGAGVAASPSDVNIADTLRSGSTAWSFDSAPIDAISNQYAAMPSLHVAWSMWCALVLLRTVRRRWLQCLALAHPLITVLAVVSTGNHFFLDAIGGMVVLAIGYLLAISLDAGRSRLWQREPIE